MNGVGSRSRTLLVGMALAFVIATADDGISEALAQTGDARAETLRPEIGKPLKAAQDFIDARKFAEARAPFARPKKSPTGPRTRTISSTGSEATPGFAEILAIAYLNAGRMAKAIQAFKTVQGSDGAADLARLWLIHAQRSTS